MQEPIDIVLSRLSGVKKCGAGWSALCPAHNDRNPSLSVKRGDGGQVLLYCHAGCTNESIVETLGLSFRDLAPAEASPAGTLGRAPRRPKPRNGANGKPRRTPRDNGKGRIVATYPYRDETGRVLFEVVRFDPKDFRQRRPDGHGGYSWSVKGVRKVLYRLPEVVAANGEAWLFVVEGEKDADRLAGAGLVATCNAGGAGKWLPDYSDCLDGRRVCILSDNDQPGRDHAAAIALSIFGKAAAVRVVELPGLPDHGDVSSWLDAGGTPAVLCDLAETAPEWRPTPSADEQPQAANHRPRVVCLADVQPEPIRWLWPGRVALGKLTLIVGDPGLGKSLLTLDLAARVSSGCAWPDAPLLPGEPGSVVLLSAEDDLADTIWPRLDAAAADVARIVALDIACLRRGLPDLEQVVQEAGDVRLVVIDPVAAYLGQVDSHKNADVRAALAPLAELAGRHRVAVVAVSHLNKNAGGAAIYRAQGSLAFTAAARAVWLVVPDKGDTTRRLFLPVKANLTREPLGLAYRIVQSAGTDAGRVEWEQGAVRVTAEDALSIDRGEMNKPSALQEAGDWLSDTLARGAVRAKVVKERAARDGIKPRTLDRAKTALGVCARRNGYGPGGQWVWELPAPPDG